MKICRLPVLPLEVQVIYRSSHFWRPTILRIVHNDMHMFHTATSCRDYTGQPAGRYNISVGGKVKQVHCSGSGWTIIQGRWDNSGFDRSFAEYEEVFGDLTIGEYWIGLKALAELTKTPRQLSIIMHNNSPVAASRVSYTGLFGTFQVFVFLSI